MPSMTISLDTLDSICQGRGLRLARPKTRFAYLFDGTGVYLEPDALTERAMIFETESV
jgi:hypothetical protein